MAPKQSAPSPIDLPKLMVDVFRVTQELFPGEVSARVMNDPEYPEEHFTVIEAQASSPPRKWWNGAWNGIGSVAAVPVLLNVVPYAGSSGMKAADYINLPGRSRPRIRKRQVAVRQSAGHTTALPSGEVLPRSSGFTAAGNASTHAFVHQRLSNCGHSEAALAGLLLADPMPIVSMRTTTWARSRWKA